MASQQGKHPLASHVSRALGAGFALLILLMVLLDGHAIWSIQLLEGQMRTLVDVKNRKIQLATDLLEAAYNRHSALIYQTLADDPFDRDDNFQLYIKWGYYVGKARKDLKALPLNDFELKNLQKQDAMVSHVIALQERISDLATRGLKDEAQSLISTELRPLNLQFTDAIEGLRAYERDSIRAALESTRGAAQKAVEVHIFLGGVLLVLAIGIATATFRQLSRRASTIDQQFAALEEVSDQLEHEATHDQLTGLANRSLFYQRLNTALEHAEQEGFPVGVMYLDLDYFKPINDQFGHAAGDMLLVTLAARLKQQVRISDTVARLGGDEFAVVLLGTGSAKMLEALSAAISQPVDFGSEQITPQCSIGYAEFPSDGRNLDALINTADLRMYENKQSRRQPGSSAESMR